METNLTSKLKEIYDKLIEVEKLLGEAENALDDMLVNQTSNCGTEHIILRVYLMTLRDSLFLAKRYSLLTTKQPLSENED